MQKEKTMKIAISAESTVDLSTELLEQFDIKTTPFTITLGEQVFCDDQNISKKIFEFVEKNKTLPKTSAVNQFQYQEHFSSLLKSYDAIVHISISSQMSSAYQNALNASKQFENVFVVDSKTLSTGIALLAIKARNLANDKIPAKDIAEIIQDQTQNVQADFILENLQYLYRGGRCSSLSLLGANLLKIKPLITVRDGKMTSSKKFMGNFSTCVEKYSNHIFETYKNPDLQYAFVTCSSADKDIIDNLVEKLKNRGFKNIFQTFAGGTICSHCGPNCLGILFLNNPEN